MILKNKFPKCQMFSTQNSFITNCARHFCSLQVNYLLTIWKFISPNAVQTWIFEVSYWITAFRLIHLKTTGLRIIAELHKLLLSKIGTKYQTCLTTISPAWTSTLCMQSNKTWHCESVSFLKRKWSWSARSMCACKIWTWNSLETSKLNILSSTLFLSILW